MKTRLFLSLFITLISLSIQAHTLEPLHVDGRYLKNSKGDIVTLHGYMTVLDPGCQADEFRSTWDGYDVSMCLKNKKAALDAVLKSGWKMDYVRFMLDPYWCCDLISYDGENYFWADFDFERFKKYFEEVMIPLLDYYHEKGIYTLLFPPLTAPEEIEAGDEFQQHLMLLWSYVSSHPRIKNNPGVMFELANEPIKFNCRQEESYDGYWGFVNNVSSAFREVRDYWQPIVDKIRSHCNNIIYIPGMLYESDHAGFADYPVRGDNIGYAVHWYPGWWGNMRKDWEDHVFPIAYKAPIIITENAWAPTNNYLGGNAETSTSKFGKPLKSIVDELGNVSWNCYEPEVDYYYLVNSSSSSDKAVIANDPEACFKAMYQWWDEYENTKVMPTSQLKAKSVSFDNFPTAFTPGQKSIAKIKAEFTNGMTWDVSGDAEYTVSDESVLTIKSGVIKARKEGTATVGVTYTDGTGQSFSKQFEIICTLFPLTKEGFVLDQFSHDAGGSFDESTGTFSSGGPGSGGWDFENGKDLSSYKYLVLQLNQKQHCWTKVHITDSAYPTDEAHAWNDDINDIGFPFNDETELVIDLHSLHNLNGEPLDLSHIYRVDIWINGVEGSVSIKRVFLSNDGETPAYQEPTRVYADNKVIYRGDEMPTLTFSNSGPAINGTPKLSTIANSSLVGTFPITIERGSVTNEDITFIDGTLTIWESPNPIGDANGDYIVNAADIVEVVNYIMGNPTEKFTKSAADVNCDGVVNAADIVAIVNIIMSDQEGEDEGGAAVVAEIDWTQRSEYLDLWYSDLATVSVEQGTGLIIDCAADGTGNYWEPQVPMIGHIPSITEGGHYQVKFTAQSPVAGELRLDFCSWEGAGASHSKVFDVTTEMQEYVIDFKGVTECTDAMIFYQCGKLPGRHIIQKVQVIDLNP